MGQEKEFYNLIAENLKAQQKKINPKDYKFYLVDRFIKYAKHIDYFADNCIECKNFKSDIEKVSSDLDYYLNRSKTNKLEYELINDKILNHLNKKHGIKPSQYFTSLYSIFGIVIGSFSGIILSYLLYNGFSKFILFVLLIGFLIGNILGYRKDKKLKTKNLQL